MPFDPNEVTYNPRSGRYQRADGQFVGKEAIQNLIAQEQQRLAARLQGHTRLMVDRQISLAEWESRMAGSLRDSHLAIGAVGSGGKSRMTSRQFGAIGYQLRRQFQYLDGFAQALHQGKLTRTQAIARAGLYADSITTTFHRAEQISRQSEGFDEALRALDPQAKHCPSCLTYSTNGQWKPLVDVVSPGNNCECGQRCKCQIYYRKSGNSTR